MGDFPDDDYREFYHRQRREGYGLNTRIMLTAIISLVFVIVMVVLLHLYARYLLRRQARRRQAMLQLGIGLSSAAEAHQVRSSTDPPRTGLEPSVISSLPIFIFKRSVGGSGGADIVECSVCLSTIEEEEMVRLLPNCKHTFHVHCIDMWLNGHSTCPVCRTEAEPRSQPADHDHHSIEVPRREAPAATAPPIDSANSMEGTGMMSETAGQSAKLTASSSSRLSSFRRMLSRERSGSRRVQPCEQGAEGGVVLGDLERQ